MAFLLIERKLCLLSTSKPDWVIFYLKLFILLQCYCLLQFRDGLSSFATWKLFGFCSYRQFRPILEQDSVNPSLIHWFPDAKWVPFLCCVALSTLPPWQTTQKFYCTSALQ